MRIVIDLQGAQTSSALRGIGRYTTELVKAILRQNRKHDVIVVLSGLLPDINDRIHEMLEGLLPPGNIVVWEGVGPAFYGREADTWRREASAQVREAFLASLSPDCVLVTSLFEGFLENAVGTISSFPLRVPTAVILYDLIPFIYPDLYLGDERTQKWYADKIENLRRADLWLAISESARREAIDRLDLPKGRVHTIYTAADQTFRPVEIPPAQAEVLLRKFNINRPFLLTTGGSEPRKNLERLIDAFGRLPGKIAERYQLVVYGCSNAQNRLTVNGWIDKYYARPERFVILNYVSDSDLVELYNLCELFVFPSWHEGFGLPALEAMQSGAATIAADATSLPEVLGRRDALFDPFDVASIAGKIAQVLFDDTLRADLAAHGLQQARTFSWDDTARKAIEAVEEAVRKHKIRAVPQEKIYRTVISQIGKVQGPGSAPEDADLITLAGSIDSNMAAACRLQRPLELPKQLTWRVEGPFDSSYSLALLNRETARALKGLGHEVALHSTEGPGDFPPTQAFLEANPDLAELHARSQRISPQISDVVSRNLYPPRVFDMEGAVNLLHHYAWEETGFPSEWAEEFNTHLNGVACLSSHVEKILVDHGVACHLEVSGCGTDHWERVEPDGDFVLDTKRSFRFLHVSSCFPRKGVDLLLKAYGSSFSSGDDVVLVIKTFPNPHNEIHGWLGQAKVDNPSYPDVLIIEDDLTDSALKSLYRQCNALVAPSKAEGYGLPMAEAMLSGLPVITTAWGGQRDFCDEETAWLVDYEFELAQSHFGLFDSVWARPSVEDLAATMRTLFDLPAAKRRKRADRGRERLLANSRWIHVAERLEKITRHAVIEPSSVRPRVGWVSAWNTRCGIASYSEHLLDNMSSDITVLAPANQPLEQADGQNVLRCWQTNGHDDLENLRASVEENDFDVIIVQFNYGFFSFDALGRFIEYMLNRGRTVIVTLHATSDPQGDAEWGRQKRLELLREPLSRCSRLLVHTVEDLNRLKGLGLVDNVVLFPHGILDFNSESRTLEDGVFTVATYGFFLPHKGLLETIEAISILKERGLPVRLRMMNAEYPVLISAELIMRAKALIKERGLEDIVRLDTSFLSVHESLRRLGDTDLIVFPYQQTGESSSAAVRYGLAVGRPVAVTPLPIFQDVSPLVLDLPGLTAVDIANGIEQLRKELINDPECYRRMKPDADRWRETHRYSHLGRRLDGMIVALHRKRKRSAVSAC